MLNAQWLRPRTPTDSDKTGPFLINLYQFLNYNEYTINVAIYK